MKIRDTVPAKQIMELTQSVGIPLIYCRFGEHPILG